MKKGSFGGRKGDNITEMTSELLHLEGTGQKSSFVQEDPVIQWKRKGHIGNIKNRHSTNRAGLVGQNSVATLSLTSNRIMSNQTAK